MCYTGFRCPRGPKANIGGDTHGRKSDGNLAKPDLKKKSFFLTDEKVAYYYPNARSARSEN